MFSKKFLFIFLTCLLLGLITAKSPKKQKGRRTGLSQHGTSFDYDFGIEPETTPHGRRSSSTRSKSRASYRTTTTTPRPLVRYWNSFVRSVRLPVPRISWNVTTPLVDLFGTGTTYTNPPNSYSTSYETSSNKKSRTKKRKSTKKTKTENSQIANADSSQGVLAQMLEEQYPDGLDSNTPMYFYDPNTQQYYAVQRVRAYGNYIEGTSLFNQVVPVINEGVSTHDAHKPHGGHSERGNNENSLHRTQATEPETYYPYSDDPANDIDLSNAEEIDLDKINGNSATSPPANTVQSTTNDSAITEADSTEKIPLLSKDEEMLRNMLGNFMLDDRYNLQRQRVYEQKPPELSRSANSKQRPRNPPNYFLLFNV